VRAEIKAVKRELKIISKARRKQILAERERHLRRARLHKRLAKVYRDYANCPDHECRVRLASVLARFQDALQRLNRNILGSKEETGQQVMDGIHDNVYTRQLADALNNCAPDDTKCRAAVVVEFRRQNEERDRAVLRVLVEEAKKEVSTRVATCATGDKREVCVAEVQKWESGRLAELQSHLIKLEEQRALRMCDSMPDVAACRASVNKEFKKDEVKAVSNAAEAAATEVSKAIESIAPSIGVPVVAVDGKVSAGRSASASTIAVSLTAVVAALLFLL